MSGTWQVMAGLALALRRCGLTSLDLAHNRLGPRGANLLADALERNPQARAQRGEGGGEGRGEGG